MNRGEGWGPNIYDFLEPGADLFPLLAVDYAVRGTQLCEFVDRPGSLRSLLRAWQIQFRRRRCRGLRRRDRRSRRTPRLGRFA